ncbi:uncharacterized protein C2orf81 homolog [Strigops habroptila]|uniref:uncharacterized protein C2orf81 homolog n=1 Tax=Strigops habroptila TaxID=2489341 RepID=UPI0011CF20A3|nr:uncharacterized protein C2orf81 homolog [Strigops habroptila]
MYWGVLGCTGVQWEVLECDGMYWAILGCSGMYWGVLGCTVVHWGVLAHAGMYLGCAGMHLGVLGLTGVCWGAMGCTGVHWGTLGHTGAHWAAPVRAGPAPPPRAPTPALSPQKGPSRERAAAPRPRGERPRLPPGCPPAGPELAAPWLPRALRGQRDDSDVAELLRELLERVMRECARASAVRERVPFTVGQARDALLQIAQWRFPLRDEGDLDPGGEDEEPQPCTGDSWAEGAVPVLSTQRCPDPVSNPCTPFPGGQLDPDAVAEAGSSPVQPPSLGDVSSGSDIVPGPGPPTPEPPQDEAAAAPRFLKGKPARAQAPLPRVAPLRPARPPAPRPARPPAPPEPPGPDRPPRSSYGDEEGSVVFSGHKPRLPPLSRSSIFSLWSGRAPRSSVPKRGGSGSVLAVPGLCPGRRPERWIRPQVEVLEPGAGRRSRGSKPSSSRLHRGPVTAAGTQPQTAAAGSRPPHGAEPRQLGSLLDPARLAPGVTVRWGGCVRRGGRGEQEQEEEEEETGELRPICPSAPSAPIAAGRVTGEQ